MYCQWKAGCKHKTNTLTESTDLSYNLSLSPTKSKTFERRFLISQCFFGDYLIVFFNYIVLVYNLNIFTGKILSLDKCVTFLMQIPVIIQY